MILFINSQSPSRKYRHQLYQSEKISLFSDDDFTLINLSENASLFIWGKIYGVTLASGQRTVVDLNINGETLLASLFSRLPVSKAVKRVEGRFVAVLIRKDEICVFGDSFNSKEVFYLIDKESIIASTSLEPVARRLKTSKYSQSSLVNLLSIYGYYAPKKHTIYQDIKRLGVKEKIYYDGRHVTLEEDAFAPLSIRNFGMQDHHTYYDLLREAISLRSSSECNWIYMSSGWDSSTILALLVNIHGPQKVRCVIGRMKYSNRSGVINQFELDRATKLANYFGVKIDYVDFDLTRNESLTAWEDLAPKLKNKQIYTYQAFNFYRLAQFVSQHGQKEHAVFAGEISDGIHNLGFSQYATILEHPDLGFREYSDKMSSYLFGPTFLASILNDTCKEDFVYKALAARAGAAHFDDPTQLSEQEKKVKFLASFFHRKCRLPFYGLHNCKLITKEGGEVFDKEMTETYLNEVAEKLSPENVYSCLLHLYNSYHWQGSTVRMMSNGIRDLMNITLALPYWDSRLFRFLCEMPEGWGRGLELRPTKYPLKWMLKNKIDYPHHLQTGPHSYLYDINPQFSHTSEFLFGSAMTPYLQDILRDKPYKELLDPTCFNLNYIDKIVDTYLVGEEFGGTEASDLLSIVNLCLVGWF